MGWRAGVPPSPASVHSAGTSTLPAWLQPPPLLFGGEYTLVPFFFGHLSPFLLKVAISLM